MDDDQRKQEYLTRVGDYLKTFTTAHGRRVLQDMRRQYCGHTFDEDPFRNAYNDGKREVVTDIEAVLILGKNPKRVEELFRQPEDDNYTL